MKTKQAMMTALEKQFPKLEVRDGGDFYGYDTQSIWMPNAYDFGVRAHLESNSEIDQFLKKHGWHIEPYDSETMLAYLD